MRVMRRNIGIVVALWLSSVGELNSERRARVGDAARVGVGRLGCLEVLGRLPYISGEARTAVSSAFDFAEQEKKMMKTIKKKV